MTLPRALPGLPDGAPTPAVRLPTTAGPTATVTATQARLLRRIAKLHEATGLWPSLTNLASLLGISYSAAQQRVYALERKGWLLRSRPGGEFLDPHGVRLPANADLSRLRVSGEPDRDDAPRPDSAGGVVGRPGPQPGNRRRRRGQRMESRACLSCGKQFASEGSHNRICDACKGTADWRAGSDAAPYRVIR